MDSLSGLANVTSSDDLSKPPHHLRLSGAANLAVDKWSR